MKKTSKVILMSCLTTAFCASLIAGSTFALFTSESKTNIAITAGKVSVTAKVKGDPVVSSTLGTPLGTASLDGDKIEIAGFCPGDMVEFDVQVTNESTVAVKWQLQVIADEPENALFRALDFSVEATSGTVGELVQLSTMQATPWNALDAAKDGSEEIAEFHVKIALPEETTGTNAEGEAVQGEDCSLTLKVSAVQGNAHTADPVATAFNIAAEGDFAELVAALGDPMTAAEVTAINLLGNMELDDWTPLPASFAGLFEGNGFTVSYTGEADPEVLVEGMSGAETDIMPAAEGLTVQNLTVRRVKDFGKRASWDSEGVKTVAYQINNVDGLKFFRDIINSDDNNAGSAANPWGTNKYPFAGETVELTQDIDLQNEPWIRIGVSGNTYKKFGGTFNGNGYEFQNVVIGKAEGDAVNADPAYFVGDVFNTLTNNTNGYNTGAIAVGASLNYTVHNDLGGFEMVYVWNNYTTTTANKTTVEKNWYINSVEGLKLFRDIVNYAAGHQYATRFFTDDTVTLTSDMDLGNELWVCIGTGFAGKFESGRYVFKNVETATLQGGVAKKSQEWGQIFQNYTNTNTTAIDYTVHNAGALEQVSHYEKASGAAMTADHQWYVHNAEGYRELVRRITGSSAHSSGIKTTFEGHTVNLETNLTFDTFYPLEWYSSGDFYGTFEGGNHTITYRSIYIDKAQMEHGRLVKETNKKATVKDLTLVCNDEALAPMGGRTTSYNSAGEFRDVVYEIASFEQLKTFGDVVGNGVSFLGETVRLTQDIAFPAGEPWTPIGGSSDTAAFSGIFDGNGYTITNFSSELFAGEGTLLAGLFMAVKDATVKDLRLQGTIDVTSTEVEGMLGVGAFAAIAYGSSTFENCVSEVDITVTGESVYFFVGGFAGSVGANSNLSFVNCLASGDISTEKISTDMEMGGVGGFVGGCLWGSIVLNVKTSLYTGKITVGDGSAAGAIAGMSISGSFENVYTTAQAPASYESSVTLLGAEQAALQENYAEFDFVDTWAMDETAGHAVLKAFQG